MSQHEDRASQEGTEIVTNYMAIVLTICFILAAGLVEGM
jgi:hypothetical protein